MTSEGRQGQSPAGAIPQGAGQALDRYLAEHVMGWKYEPEPHRPYYRHSGNRSIFDWNPSTDIANAMEVVTLFQSRGWGFGLVGYAMGAGAETGEPYKAAFFAQGQPERTAFAETPQLAICLAAAQALGGKARDV